MELAVVFSGAGLSRESGIPTFRDAKDGLWENYKIEEVANHASWPERKSLMLDFYGARTVKALACQPNEGHKALARLQERYRVVNITQNIDTLLESAGCKEVWHLHGDIGHRKCEWHRSIPPISHWQYKCNFRAPHSEPVKLGDLCPQCGGQMRPDIVWFGEAVDMRQTEVDELAEKARVFIVVGTSGVVYPAAGLITFFRNARRKFYVDPQPPDYLTSFRCLAGAAGAHLPNVVQELLVS